MIVGLSDAAPNLVGDLFRADALVGWKVREQSAEQIRFNGSGTNATNANRMINALGRDGRGEKFQPSLRSAVDTEAGEWIDRRQ